MAKRGNPNIREDNKASRFTSETARAAGKKSGLARAEAGKTFKCVSAYTDRLIPVEELGENYQKFFESKGITEVTYMMRDLAPLWQEAQQAHDLPTLITIYKLLGLTFESKREQNVNITQTTEHSGTIKVEFEIVEPSKIEY